MALTPPTTRTLEAPGATLTYDVRPGSGGDIPLFLKPVARLLCLLSQPTFGAIESELNDEPRQAKEGDIRGQNDEGNRMGKDERADGGDGAENRQRDGPAQQPERAQRRP